MAWLLDHGADPNYLTRWGERPLHHALSRGNAIGYFELLLDHGANPVLPSQDGTPAYAVAARMARGDVLDLFDRRGFSVQLQGDDAFLAACARADIAGARRIAANDPSLVKRLEAQKSGLLADFAGAGNADSVRLLLDLGFDIGSQRANPPWLRGETALHVAAWRGRRAAAKLLIERGAPLEARNGRGETPLAVTLRALVEQSEWTPNEHSVGIAQDLLNAGARLDPVELTLAAALCLGLADDVARLAREAGVKDRQMALAAAAVNGNVQAIARLIDLGVELNAYNIGSNPDATALHNAVGSGSLDAVKLLVEAGADVGARDKAWQATPLVWADYYVREKSGTKQYAEIVTYLREKSGE
jgi:ankyrin repeat protein